MTIFKTRSPLRLTTAPCLFAGVLLIRLIVLGRLTGSPFLLPSRGDMHFYNDWAHRILDGHLSDHLAFYGLPGYAWLLAILYKIGGVNPFLPAFIQAGLDAGTAMLLYKISLRVFAEMKQVAPAIGMLAAAGWAFFVPAQTYSAILMPTAWVVFIFWFVVWRIVKEENAPGKFTALIFGFVIGLSATAVATVLFLLPLIAAAIWFKTPRADFNRARSRATALTLLAAGVIAGTAPCWTHNYFLARDPVFLSAHSGINFWIGNNPEANGYPRFPPGLRAGQAAMLQDSIDAAETAAGHPLKRGDVSRYWSGKARNYIRAHPLAWIKLLGIKLRNICNAFQYDDLSIISPLREQGVTFPGIYFGLLAAIAIPGAILAWKIAPLSRWLAGAIALHLLALLPVFTTERYRLPIVPGLLIFAAFGLLLFWQNATARQFGPALAYATLVGLSALFVSWPQRDPSLWALDAYNSGWQALESGNIPLAENKLQLAHAYVPSNAETNFALGNLRLAQGNISAASAFYLTTLQLDNHHPGALNNLGVLALNQHQFDLAETWFCRALEFDAHNAKTHFLLAKAYVGKGDRTGARTEIDSAIALNPDPPEFRQLREEIRASQRP